MIVTSQIAASNEKMYHDAYTLQRVEADNLQNFNFVSGMVPFLLNLILDVSLLYFTASNDFELENYIVGVSSVWLFRSSKYNRVLICFVLSLQRKEGKILNSKKAHRLCQVSVGLWLSLIQNVAAHTRASMYSYLALTHTEAYAVLVFLRTCTNTY